MNAFEVLYKVLVHPISLGIGVKHEEFGTEEFVKGSGGPADVFCDLMGSKKIHFGVPGAMLRLIHPQALSRLSRSI